MQNKEQVGVQKLTIICPIISLFFGLNLTTMSIPSITDIIKTHLVDLTSITDIIKTRLIDLISIIIYLLIFIFVTMFVLWLFKKENIVVLPFDVGNGVEKYNGKAISDLFVHELKDIQRIHELKDIQRIHKIKYKGSFLVPIGPIETEKVASSISLASTNEMLTYDVSAFGTVTVGPISASLGQL